MNKTTFLLAFLSHHFLYYSSELNKVTRVSTIVADLPNLSTNTASICRDYKVKEEHGSSSSSSSTWKGLPV
ncbi:hypothetical protein F0562_031485 [Nyssa sinensis]|uniref:Uncharacterized protein n=1 Tax=Nyssa sinensis TaxID=561372 RepID=A0A5J5AUC8_9ASTE|nr:hypothetical protein F0562_031485 [Nyssa sinensis]